MLTGSLFYQLVDQEQSERASVEQPARVHTLYVHKIVAFACTHQQTVQCTNVQTKVYQHNIIKLGNAQTNTNLSQSVPFDYLFILPRSFRFPFSVDFRLFLLLNFATVRKVSAKTKGDCAAYRVKHKLYTIALLSLLPTVLTPRTSTVRKGHSLLPLSLCLPCTL